jgi:hypothetical protein
MAADIVTLHKPKDAELLEQYRYAIDGGYSQLIPLDHLLSLREAIEASLRPAAWPVIVKAVGVLVASFKVGSVLQDKSAFTQLMMTELAAYPEDILDQAITQARRTIKWLPSIAEMIELCDGLVGERRRRLGIITRLIEEQEREQEKAELEDRDVRLREEQAARIRALHGIAVSPEDIKFAGDFRPFMRWPLGKFSGWAESLDRGELWAAKFCSRLALVVRAQRCEDHVLIRHEHTVALAELVIADEAAARRQVEDMEAGNIKDRLPLPESLGDLETAVSGIEAAAWSEHGIFEDDCSAPDPIVQNERFAKRFGPPPDATLDFTEDPQKVGAELKRAAEVFRAHGMWGSDSAPR